MEESQVESAVPVSEPNDQEAMLSQSEVNKIVKREKAKAAEAARREAYDQYQRDLESIQANQVNAAKQQERNQTVSRDVDADALYQQVQEKFNKEMQERQMKDQVAQVAQTYLAKIDQGRGAYEDFDDVTKDFDPAAFPQLTYLLAGLDNAADVLYHLNQNSLKLAGLDSLAMKNPRKAHAELIKLSTSLAANKQALADADSNQVAEPLDRLQPSRVSGSNGKMSMRDMRNLDWLRG